MRFVVGSTCLIVTIPEGVRFDDLNLVVQNNGVIDIESAPLRRIAEANPDLRLDDDAGILNLLEAWYNQLRPTGYRNEVGEKWLASSDWTNGSEVAHLWPASKQLH